MVAREKALGFWNVLYIYVVFFFCSFPSTLSIWNSWCYERHCLPHNEFLCGLHRGPGQLGVLVLASWLVPKRKCLDLPMKNFPTVPFAAVLPESRFISQDLSGVGWQQWLGGPPAKAPSEKHSTSVFQEIKFPLLFSPSSVSIRVTVWVTEKLIGVLSFLWPYSLPQKGWEGKFFSPLSKSNISSATQSGPGTSSIARELVRNGHSWALPQVSWSRISQVETSNLCFVLFCWIFYMCSVLFIYFKFLFYIAGVQQSDSVIHIHVSVLFQILFPFRLLNSPAREFYEL